MGEGEGSAAVPSRFERQRLLLTLMLEPEGATALTEMPPDLRAEIEAALAQPVPSGFLESPLYVAGADEFDAAELGVSEPDPQAEPG